MAVVSLTVSDAPATPKIREFRGGQGVTRRAAGIYNVWRSIRMQSRNLMDARPRCAVHALPSQSRPNLFSGD
jgi:hypothetical protein